MGSRFDQWANLREQSARVRLDFIRTDLQVCLTLTRVAETEYDLGNWEHGERTLAEAEQGYSTLLRFFSQARNVTAEAEHELEVKFKELRKRLDGLQRLRKQDSLDG